MRMPATVPSSPPTRPSHVKMYSSGVSVSFHGMITTPTTPVISAPVRKLISLGARFARSYAGETTFAAMFTETVATSTVTRA